MTTKEKAQQLHDDIYKVITNGKCHRNKYLGVEYIPDKWKEAKECALIVRYELEKQEAKLLGYDPERYSSEYWQEVKIEIEKL